MKSVELIPKLILDDDWKELETLEIYTKKFLKSTSMGEQDAQEPDVYTRGRGFLQNFPSIESEEAKILQDIQKIRIQIAPNVETDIVKSDARYDYLKSELGMNIVLPKGSIEQLRLFIHLGDNDNDSKSIVAIDGFPKNKIEEKFILDGKIQVALDKSFMFIPIFGGIISDMVKIELKPWPFRLGKLRQVDVSFSGGLTNAPEWYFKNNGVPDELRIGLTIKKLKIVKEIKASVRAQWIYDPGMFRKRKIGSDDKILEVFKQEE